MKTTRQGASIPDRLWYYLLDFNDQTAKQYIWENFRKETLLDMTRDEIISLTNHAMCIDLGLTSHDPSDALTTDQEINPIPEP